MAIRRRFGKIRKLPSGRWQARYLGPDERERTADRTFSTKGEADRWLVNAEADLLRGTWMDPNLGSVRLRDYAEAWIGTRTVKGRPLRPRTLSNYRILIRNYVEPTLGGLPLSSVSPERIRVWNASVAQVGATTAAQCYRLLHAILASATTEGIYARNPCQLRGAGKPDTPERPLITPGEAAALAEAMPDHLQAFIHLAFWGGLRLGELLALQHSDVTFDDEKGTATVRVERQQQHVDGEIVIGPPKSESMRTVNLSGPVVPILEAHMSAGPSRLPTARVFSKRAGGILRDWDVHSPWNKARNEVGLPGVHIHDLRHGGLTLAAQSGATLAEVMRRAGHSTARAAMIYQHAADDRDAALADRMAALAAGMPRSDRARSGHEAVLELKKGPVAKPAKRAKHQ